MKQEMRNNFTGYINTILYIFLIFKEESTFARQLPGVDEAIAAFICSGTGCAWRLYGVIESQSKDIKRSLSSAPWGPTAYEYWISSHPVMPCKTLPHNFSSVGAVSGSVPWGGNCEKLLFKIQQKLWEIDRDVPASDFAG